MENIPQINIGIIGSVSHGKSRLLEVLTGKNTMISKAEKLGNKTINLGSAHFIINRRKDDDDPFNLTDTTPDMKLIPGLKVSFVDCPGHEVYTSTMKGGSVLMDAALLIISSAEKCPQEQTERHVKIIEMVKVKQVIIVQTKIDLVLEEEARLNYLQIKDFSKKYRCLKHSPIIPVSSISKINLGRLKHAIAKLEIPKQNIDTIPKLSIIRSFDINKPGIDNDKLKGGVIGGTLLEGSLEIGDILEIKPGLLSLDRKRYYPIFTKIVEMKSEFTQLEKVKPGILVGLQTNIDPKLTKNNGLIGFSSIGRVGTLTNCFETIKIWTLFDEISKDEKLEIITKTNIRVQGLVISHHSSIVTIKLSRPTCFIIRSEIYITSHTRQTEKYFTGYIKGGDPIDEILRLKHMYIMSLIKSSNRNNKLLANLLFI